MKTAEEACESKDKRIEEIQRLLEGMEQESTILRETIRNREEELYELRQIRQEGQKGEQRYANTHTHTHTWNTSFLNQSVKVKSGVCSDF